jgi:hypothetical protein
MNTTANRIVAAVCLFLILGSAASAQDAPASGSATPAPTDRATVKSDARNAEQAGAMPHGDLPIPAVTPSNAPSPDRATMKKDTAAYNKSKQPTWMPNNGSYNQGNTMKSTADRASVKAATKDAETRQTIPRGQAAQPMTSAQ